MAGSAAVADRAPDTVLVDPPAEVEALEQELDRGCHDRRPAAPSVTSNAPSRRTASSSPGTSRIQRTYSRDGTRSPVSTPSPSSNATTTSSRSSRSTRRLNVANSAFVISRSTMRSSGASSPTVSSSTLPAVEAMTAPRSEMRGAATGSPSRTARLSAAASRTSMLATLTRTLTPDRWLISGDRRARWVSSATSSSMNAGHHHRREPSSAVEALLLLADDRDLVRPASAGSGSGSASRGGP